MGKKPLRLWAIVENEVHELIADDQLGSASELLREVTEVLAKPYLGEAIVIQRGWKSLERKKIRGTLDFATEAQEENRLSARMMDFLARITSSSVA